MPPTGLSWLQENLYLRLIALATAIALWIAVGHEQIPWVFVTKDRTLFVQVEARDRLGALKGTDVSIRPTAVEIVLSGEQRVISSVSPQDLDVYVNVEGNADKAWVVVAPPPDVTVKSVEPRQVAIHIAKRP